MAIIHMCDQRSEEWDRLRLGIPTSSEFKKIVTPGGKLSTQAEGYMDELLAAWLHGGPLEDPETDFRSQWMERGCFLEQQARDAYSFITDREVKLVGFVTTDDGMIGASTDGLIGEDGVLELKVPSPKVHVRYMRKRTIEQDYLPQLQGELYVCERDWVDTVSHCPPYPHVVVRVDRDETYIKKLADALDAFIDTLLTAREKMEREYEPFINRIRSQQPDPFGGLGVSMADIA